MGNCIYTININGQQVEFSSDEELNSYLRKNRGGINSYLLSQKVFLSKDRTTQQDVFNRIGAVSSAITFTEEDHTFRRNDGNGVSEYTPVTKLLSPSEARKPNRFGMKIVEGFSIPKWKQETGDRMQKQLKEDGTPMYTPEQIDEYLTRTVKSWETQGLLGTSWHKVAQAFFEGRIANQKDIIDTFPEMSNLTNHVLDKYINSLTKLKNNLLVKHPEALFLCEQNLFDDDSKVAGIADLLVIDKEGKVHIYDYKTSVKEELVWDSNKQTGVRYQLGFYRQMLRRQGFDVRSTHVIPIEIREIDYMDKVIKDFEINAISPRNFRETEPLMANIRRIMPYSFSDRVQDVTGNKSTHVLMKEGFNYDQVLSTPDQRNVDAEYDRMLSRQRNPDAKMYYWNPINDWRQTYEIPKTKTEEEVKAQISEVLRLKDKENSELPNIIINFVRDAKNTISEEGKDMSDIAWPTQFSSNSDTIVKAKDLLYKYIEDPSWQPVDSDALADINTASFENVMTGEVDFLVLTAQSLSAKPDLAVGTSILGNFIKDRHAKELPMYKEATNADVEHLKVYSFIKNNKELFLDRKIGTIGAVSLLRDNEIADVKIQTIDALETWYSQLATMDFSEESGLKGTMNSWVPQQIDKTDAMIALVTSLIEDKDWKNKTPNLKQIKALVTDYREYNGTNIGKRVEILGKLSNELVYSIKNVSNAKFTEYKDTGLLIKLCNEGILQLLNIPIIIEQDLKKWGNILNENANTTDPNMFKNVAVKELVSAVRDALNNTRSAFMEEVDGPNGIKAGHSAFYKAQGNAFTIKTIGYNLDMFENLIEKADGKPLMRFRDLNDPELNPAQKTYIKWFLDKVNTIRVETMEKRGATDEDIAEFLHSPAARNIPLLKASSLTAWKGKNTKEWIDSQFRDIMNPNNVFKDDPEANAKVKRQADMVNSFEFFDDYKNKDKRDAKIDTAANGEFETDLEMVMSMYMMAHVKQIEINKKLPLINAIKNVVMLHEIYNFTPSENTISLLEDYTQTTIWGKGMLAGESEGLAKTSAGLQKLTSFMVMGFSPASGLTELLTGFFGNVTRVAANKLRGNMFGFKEYSQGSALAVGTLMDNKFSYEHVNFADAINETYGLSDFDIRQMVHETQQGASGLVHFKSKYAFWFSTFPGYVNRMSLFLAQAIKDGVIEVNSTGHITQNSAYQMIDKSLVYNEKLDKRFSLYTANKDVPEAQQTQTYKEQKALYLTIKNALANESGGLKSDGTLARPYDNKVRDSMKEYADEVHGSYDRENQTNFQKMAFGKMFMQFKGWIRAKKNRWWTETHSSDVRGHRELIYDEAGNPQYIWKGKVTEGIAQTILAMADELKTNKGNIVKSWANMNPTQRENFGFLIADSLLLGLLTMIMSMFDTDDMKKNDPIGYQAFKSLNNSSKDLFIGNTITAVGGQKNPLALASWASKVVTDSWGVVTGQNGPSSVLKNISIYRTISSSLPSDPKPTK